MISEIQSEPESADAIVNKYTFELSRLTISEHIFKSTFTAVTQLLDRKNINLETLATEQSIVTQTFANPRHKAIALQTLRQLGKLEPIPEIHWRVDRGREEYDRRLGFDVTGFLAERKKEATESTRPILLEIGPGNGNHKHERQGMISGYDDYSLSDKLYYPLAPVIEQCLNIQAIEKGSGAKLSPEEQEALANILYKTLVIADGGTESDSITYDNEVLSALRRDINTLPSFAPALANKLGKSTMVPDTISTRDENGSVIYPYKNSFNDFSPAVQNALSYIQHNADSVFAPDLKNIDSHQYIDAFAPNTIIGDISDISRLADNQIDVELAVRSTVYSREENYVTFLKDLSAKLRDGGVAIDDSIRDNDGWYYRFAEIAEALENIPDKLEIMVILGPGFPGEDQRSDRVPLAIAITKKGSSREALTTHLNPGNELVAFEDLVADPTYLRSLDTTGLTATKLGY